MLWWKQQSAGIYDGMEYKTRGLDADQTEAAIKATMKMLNIIANQET
jgi:(R)-citramalate synthase